MKATVTALALALIFVGTSSAGAGPITITTRPGTTYATAGVLDYSPNSDRMEGMTITAYWTVDGRSKEETRIWDGGVTFTGSNFDLVVNGNTLHNDWFLDFELSGAGLLQKLVFNGIPGGTVFDRTFGGNAGTSGSSMGRDLEGFDGYDGRIAATYVNAVALGNDAPVNDIFAGLEIEFLDGGGLGQHGNWRFAVDTDTVTTPFEVQVEGSSTALQAVPEPASLLLFGTGLLGLAAVARRRARRS